MQARSEANPPSPTERQRPSGRCDTHGDDGRREPQLLMLPSLRGRLGLWAALDTRDLCPQLAADPWGGLSGASPASRFHVHPEPR